MPSSIQIPGSDKSHIRIALWRCATIPVVFAVDGSDPIVLDALEKRMFLYGVSTAGKFCSSTQRQHLHLELFYGDVLSLQSHHPHAQKPLALQI